MSPPAPVIFTSLLGLLAVGVNFAVLDRLVIHHRRVGGAFNHVDEFVQRPRLRLVARRGEAERHGDPVSGSGIVIVAQRLKLELHHHPRRVVGLGFRFMVRLGAAGCVAGGDAAAADSTASSNVHSATITQIKRDIP